MKTLAIIIAAVCLTSCGSTGIPFRIRLNYHHPDTGIDVGAGYSSKRGIEVDVSK